MKFKIEKVFADVFYKGTDDYHEITSNIINANLKVIEVVAPYSPNSVYIYTELNSFEDLNRLVEVFKCNIVYGAKTEDGTMIIEKYDSYRE